jgi:hypothetical protein
MSAKLSRATGFVDVYHLLTNFLPVFSPRVHESIVSSLLLKEITESLSDGGSLSSSPAVEPYHDTHASGGSQKIHG